MKEQPKPEVREDEALLREYDSLRQEILAHQARRDQLFLFTITALGLTFGLALEADGLPFVAVSFVPYFLVYHFCVIVDINSSHIIEVGAYIRWFLAPHYHFAMRWEDAWHVTATEGRKTPSKSGYLSSGGYWFDFSITAVSLTAAGALLLALLSEKHFDYGDYYCWVFASSHLVFWVIVVRYGALRIRWSEQNSRLRTLQHIEMAEKATTLLGGRDYSQLRQIEVPELPKEPVPWHKKLFSSLVQRLSRRSRANGHS